MRRKLCMLIGIASFSLFPITLHAAAPLVGLGAGLGLSFVPSSASISENASPENFFRYVGFFFQPSVHLKVLWEKYGVYASYEYRGSQDRAASLLNGSYNATEQEVYHRLILGFDVAIPFSRSLYFTSSPGLVFLITDLQDGIAFTAGINLSVGIRIAASRRLHIGMEVRLLEEDVASIGSTPYFDESGLMISGTFLLGKLPTSVATSDN